jgi:hypothetical protein
MAFPPSLFNIMTHLLVHIVKEINILGPVFIYNMFPFKRYMAVLKKYVRNHSSPEGCIAKGYRTEEEIEFCVDFIDDLSSIGVPMSRHEGRLKGKGTLRKKSNVHIPNNEIRKVNFTDPIEACPHLFLCQRLDLRHEPLLPQDPEGPTSRRRARPHPYTWGGARLSSCPRGRQGGSLSHRGWMRLSPHPQGRARRLTSRI